METAYFNYRVKRSFGDNGKMKARHLQLISNETVLALTDEVNIFKIERKEVYNRVTWATLLFVTFQFIKKDTCKPYKFLPIPLNIPYYPHPYQKNNHARKAHPQI